MIICNGEVSTGSWPLTNQRVLRGKGGAKRVISEVMFKTGAVCWKGVDAFKLI